MEAASGARSVGPEQSPKNGGDLPAAARLSIRVDDDLRRRIHQLKCLSGERTAAKAIRWAIEQVTQDSQDDEYAALSIEILKWAEGLMYSSPRERCELHEFSKRLYRLATRQKVDE